MLLSLGLLLQWSLLSHAIPADHGSVRDSAPRTHQRRNSADQGHLWKTGTTTPQISDWWGADTETCYIGATVVAILATDPGYLETKVILESDPPSSVVQVQLYPNTHAVSATPTACTMKSATDTAKGYPLASAGPDRAAWPGVIQDAVKATMDADKTFTMEGVGSITTISRVFYYFYGPGTQAISTTNVTALTDFYQGVWWKRLISSNPILAGTATPPNDDPKYNAIGLRNTHWYTVISASQSDTDDVKTRRIVLHNPWNFVTEQPDVAAKHGVRFKYEDQNQDLPDGHFEIDWPTLLEYFPALVEVFLP